MAPPSSNLWKNEKRYNGLLNYIIKQTKNVESPMNIYQLVRDFKKKSGNAQAFGGLRHRILKIRTVIHKVGHIDKYTKVKVLFALSAPVDADFLEELRKDALVKVDENKRITHYKAKNGNLELRGDHSLSGKCRTAQLESKGSLRSLINSYFETKDDADAVPENKAEKEMRDFIEFITEKCKNVKSPLTFSQLTKDFNKHLRLSRTIDCIQKRVRRYCDEIQKAEFLNTPSKVKQLFGLGAKLSSDYLEKLRKDAVVEVDNLNRITRYTANDGGLTLHGDHSHSAKNSIGQLASKRSHRTLINSYFENKNDVDAIAKNEEEKEIGNFIEFITEKCDTADSPLCITLLTKEFNNSFGTSRSLLCICRRVKAYCHEVQKTELLDTPSKVKQLFCLGARLDSDFLKELQKDAAVEVDDLNRITKYTSNNGRLTLHGDHSQSAKNKSGWIVKRKKKKTIKKQCISSDDEDGESEKENESEDESDEYSSEEFDSEFDSDDENNPLDETEDLLEPPNTAEDFDNETPVGDRSLSIDDNFNFDPSPEKSHMAEEIEMREDETKENDTEVIGNVRIKKSYERLSKRRYSDSEDDSDFHPKDSDDENGDQDKTQDLMEPSNEAVDSDNDTSFRYHSPSRISIDDNFDFDPPTERSHAPEEAKMREIDEKDDSEITGNAAVKTQRFETPQTPKRIAVASAQYSTSKRTKPLPVESMNSGNSNDNISHDEPPRIELDPFDGPPGLPKETQKESDVQQIPKPLPQVMEVPIKEEYEKKTQTSLKTVLNAYKSLILGLDTSGLSKLQMDLDKLMLEAGRRSDVSTKEVIMAMDFLIVKLAKHGAPKPSEDSISLRDILLMLRTIILNSSFNGLEVILEMLKENIDQLKVMDKKVPVSKVDSVLRATLDIICT